MENNTTEAEKIKVPTNVDDLLAEMNLPKQDFTPKTEIPGSGSENTNTQSEIHNQENYQFNDPSIISPADLAKAKASATFVVNAIDIGASEILTMIAKGKDPEPYTATESEKADMVEVWAEYLKDKGGDIPPGVMVLIMIIVVYGPRTKAALDNKAKDEAMEAQKTENEKLKKRIAELEKKEKKE